VNWVITAGYVSLVVEEDGVLLTRFLLHFGFEAWVRGLQFHFGIGII
jgi:hypothetical protein